MASNTTNTNPAAAESQPGLIGGHVEYVKGVAEAAIGSVTGSEAWKTSGEQDQAHGKASMQAAASERDASAQGYGKVEEIAGKVTGCEGMQQEGAASQHTHTS